MITLTPATRRLVLALAWVIAFAGLAVAVVNTLGPGVIGVDFFPVRHAGRSLLSWQSVYTDPTFVYPPSSAPLFTPRVLGTEAQAFVGWILALAGAQVVAAVLIVRMAGRSTAWAALPLIVLGSGHVLALVLGIANVTLLLVPVAVAVVGCFHRGRWTWGCALLAASLLVKPLLIALVLVPLAHRRFRALALTFLPATAVLGVSMVLVPGGTNVGRFVGYVLSGTNLRGRNSMLNLSIAGWGETHSVPTPVVLVCRAAVVAVCVAVTVRVARSDDRGAVAQLALVACLTAMLAGRLSENHFLMPVIALALLRIALAPSARVLALYGPVLLMLHTSPGLLPPAVVGPQGNSWFVAAEVLLFVVAAGEIWTSVSAKGRAPRSRSRFGWATQQALGSGPLSVAGVPRDDLAVARTGEHGGKDRDVLIARVAVDNA